jgi:hypothetical protein
MKADYRKKYSLLNLKTHYKELREKWPRTKCMAKYWAKSAPKMLIWDL